MARASGVDRGDRTGGTVLEASGDTYEVCQLESIDDVHPERWNRVVEGAPCGTVFHRHEWLGAVEDGLEHTPAHLLVEKDGNPVGVLPNFVLSLPKTPFNRLSSIYPGFGGPLASTDTESVLESMFDAVPELCGGRLLVHEIRAGTPEYVRYGTFLRSRGYEPARMGGRFLLSLDGGLEAVRDGMSQSRRRTIERARADVDHEVREEGLTQTALERFYDHYVSVMDRVGGTVYPFSFFEAFRAMESRVLLLALYVDGEYAGGFLELLDEDQSAVHGFFAAVPAEYFDVHATELLYDAVIRWGIRNGYHTYDFGGSVSDFRDGTFRFKESFGGRLVPNLYWERGAGRSWPLVRRMRSLYWKYK